MRIKLSRFAWAFALACVASLASAQVPAPQPLANVTIAVGGKSALIYLPLTIAERLGYFRDAGLNVEIADFNGGSKALQAVVGGSADVVSGVYEHTIRMQAVGQQLQAFVVMANSMQLALAVASGQAERIRTVADLKGLRIGVSAPGSTTHMMVDRVLASAHLSSRDVSIIGVGLGASAVAAISSGQIDAICTAEPTVSLLEQAGKVKVLADARTLAGTAQVFGGQVPTSALYAPSAYIRANPRITQALANAIIRADQWIAHASPADVARTVPESYHEGHTPLYIEAFTRVRDGYSTDGMFLPRGADNTLAALAAFDPKILPSAIRLSATYTNQFAEQFSKTGR